MVELKRYLNRASADVERSLLEACGIEARVVADNEGGMAPYLSYLTGVRLLVHPEDVETARSLIEDGERRQRLRVLEGGPDAEPPPAPRSPADTAFRAALAGLVVFPVGLHVYSFWHVVRAFGLWRELPRQGRRRLLVALTLDVAVLSLGAVIVLQWLRTR